MVFREPCDDIFKPFCSYRNFTPAYPEFLNYRHNACTLPRSFFPASPSVEQLKSYISAEGYQSIQELLKHTHDITESMLNKILPLESGGIPLARSGPGLGPKTDEDLLKWYKEYFLKSEGSYQYLYLDTVGIITVGKGINVMDRIHVTAKGFSFKAQLFLQEDEEGEAYQSEVLQKVKTLFRSLDKNNTNHFYIGEFRKKKLDPKTRSREASDAEILENIKVLSERIVNKKYGQKYGAGTYGNNSNAVCIDEEATEEVKDEILEEKIKEIRKLIPNYPYFPAGAQLAILDMAYNTNPYRWPKKAAELHPFYKLVNDKEAVDWTKIAWYSKDPSSCQPESISEMFKEKKACGNFYYWRKKIGDTRNVATQILLILADEWQNSIPSPHT